MESTRVLRELTRSCDGMMPESERHCVGQTMPVELGVQAGRAKEGKPSLASPPRREADSGTRARGSIKECGYASFIQTYIYLAP